MSSLTRTMHGLGTAALLVLVGCGDAGSLDDGADDAFPDASPCDVTIVFDPSEPLLGIHPQIRATAETTLPGVFDYQWEVFHDGSVAFEPAQAGSYRAIRFDAPETGVYSVRVTVPGCGFDERDVTVTDPNAAFVDLRMRVIPPPGLPVPPIDKIQRVFGGGDKTITAYFERGLDMQTHVTDGTNPVEAYLRFAPVSQPDAVIEAFTLLGNVNARLLSQRHRVLVIPVSQAFAPLRVDDWTPIQPPDFVVSAGLPISGSIVDSAGDPIANATIQLVVDGVPSTYATTAANGAFTARATVRTGPTTIAVTPPPSSGLPRLSVTTSALDLTQSLVITYGATPTRDVAGVQTAPNASVVFTGSFDAGTIRTGAATVTARGSVRAATTSNPSGGLASVRVPGVLLTAVISDAERTSLTTVDLTTAVPTTLAAPAMTPFSTIIEMPAGGPVAGAELEAVPLGALAAAGVQPVRFIANASGVVTGSLVAGARYQLRFHDPRGRASTRVVETEADAVAASYPLVKALTLYGELLLSDSDAAVDGAIVQILCGECSGVDRHRPLVETVTRGGEFRATVPDVGVQ